MRPGRAGVPTAFAVAFVVAATAGAADAQTASFFGFGNAAHVIRQTEVSGKVTGQVVVSFHGDQASGCGVLGVCGYSGTVIWNPGASVDLEIATLRVHKRIRYAGSVLFGIGPSSDVNTTARVERSVGGHTAGRCVDAEPQFGGLSGASVRGRTFTLQPFDKQSSLLATRCAGPRDGDLAAVGPRLTLPVAQVLRGERRLDLRGARPFAVDGFAGTISSTLILHLGKPTNVRNRGAGSFPPGVRTVKMRIVREHLSLVRLRGTVTESFRGSPNPDVCALLDSCGAFGTITLHPIAHAPTAQLIAQGAARLPYRDFLVALGVLRGSAPRGIGVFGDVSWDDRGNALERLTAPDQCSDAGPLRDGFVSIGVTRMVVSYSRSGPLDTLCPGPVAAGVNAQSLLSGTIRRGILNARTFRLVLSRGASLQDDGYTGSVRGSLRLTLRRGRVTQQVITEPQ